MKKKNNKGFSLIELIIAIAILVILTGLLAPQFMRYMEKARESKDMQSLDSLYGAVQTALADEAAYKEVKDAKTEIATIGTTGMSLTAIAANANSATDATVLCKEIVATLGTTDETKLWNSKAVTDAGKNTAVYVLLDKDLRVTVWIGNATTGGTVPGDTVYINASKKVKVGSNDITTAGANFFISK